MPTVAPARQGAKQYSSRTPKNRIKRTTARRTTTTAVVVPTLNPGEGFRDWLKALKGQSLKPDRLIIVDSASTDTTVTMALEAGFEVNLIQREKFSHGGTRQQMIKLLDDCEIVIFLTQDALLSGRNSLANLVAPFHNRSVAASYGRQLPAEGASAIEAHARLFNYPARSQVRSKRDIPYLGIKTSFISNSCAAWRRSALMEIGGFPSHTIQNEDAFAASKLIMAGYRIAYCADATVAHSHRYGYWQEFRRYFDIGVFHAHDRWIRKSFGQAGSEGLRYVKSEINYLFRRNPLLIPSALLRTALKLLGFKLGCFESVMPVRMKKTLSMNRSFWN